MNKKGYIVSMGLAILIMVCIIVFVSLSFIPVKVLKFKDAKFPVITKEVRAGGLLEYQADTIKCKDLYATVSRQLINGYIYNYSDITSNIPCGESYRTIQLELPRYIEPGTYFLRVTYRYKVNIFRTEKYVQDTETFTVIEDKEKL